MTTGLPAQVQAQLDEAEAIERAIAAEQATQAGQDAPEEKEQPTDTAAKVETPTNVETDKPESVTPTQPVEDATWEARFRALDGKFKAEVPRLHNQLKAAQTKVSELEAKIVSIQAAQVTVESLVTPEDEEAFGRDLLEVVRKVAKEETAAVSKKNDARVDSVNQRVETVIQNQADLDGDKFIANIAKAIPDWETINVDPAWLEWLGEYSAEVGNSRQVALDQAVETLDSMRAISLFKAFIASKPVATEKVPPVSKAQQELQSQVAPAKAASSAATPVTEKTWTGEEYERAFDVRLSHTLTPKQIEELQTEAERAYNEGRIRW